MLISKQKYQQELQEARRKGYNDAGIEYRLGFLMGQIEERNRSYIEHEQRISSIVQEAEDILREKQDGAVQ